MVFFSLSARVNAVWVEFTNRCRVYMDIIHCRFQNYILWYMRRACLTLEILCNAIYVKWQKYLQIRCLCFLCEYVLFYFICHCKAMNDELVLFQNTSWSWVQFRPSYHSRKVSALVSLLWLVMGMAISLNSKTIGKSNVLEYQLS